MKEIRFGYIVMIVFLLTACQHEELSKEPPANVEILFSTIIDGQTRSNQNTQFDSGEQIAVHISDPTGTNIYESRYYQCNGSGGLTAINATQTQYYPATELGTIYVHAAYPAKYDGLDHPAESGDSFYVPTDQTDMGTSEALYKKNDLMYGTYYSGGVPVSVNRQEEGTPIPLTFRHLMSKIVVNVIADTNHGVYESNVTGSTIVLKNIRRQVILSYSNNVGGQAVTNSSEVGSTVTIAEKSDNRKTGTALIPPQTISGAFIGITLGSGAHCDDYPVNTTFEGGKIYTYNIKCGAQSISVSTTITDWVSATPVNGSIAVQ